MYVKTLTLKGFKSFAKPTTFEFEPGVTAIVGPNGSGKSNVVDALAWVMGEQGVKTLRGGKMEDVIFAGTAKRGPLGRAQVLLTIDNGDGALPIEYSEVTISRTLFRNGSSEYAINGESCRLLDVQELLSDSGLGREMHVIVGQGQLDQVLRADPEARRGFIEEAAGILKHRRRKERTERKLASMQANMQRVSDLAAELRRQLKPLGKQAEVAKQAQHVQQEVRDASSRLLAADVAQARDQVRLARHDAAAADAEVARARDALAGIRAGQESLESSTTDQRVERASQVVADLRQAQDRLQALHTLASQRAALLAASPQQEPLDVAAAQRAASEAAAAAAAEHRRADERAVAFEQARAAAADARARVQELDAYLTEQTALVSRHEVRRAQLESEARAAGERCTELERLGEQSRADLDEARARQGQLDAALAQAEQRAERANVDLGSDGEAEAEYAAAQEAQQAASQALEHARARASEATSRRESEAARRAALELALARRDGSGVLLKAGIEGVRGLVADLLHVRPGYETAVTAALGERAEALAVDSLDAGVAALRSARSAGAGGIAAVVLDDGSRRPRHDEPASLPALPAGVVWAHDVVAGPDGALAMLSSVAFAGDLDAARRACDVVFPLGEAAAVVTLGGDVLARRLVRGGGDAGATRLQLIGERDVAAQAERDATALATTMAAEVAAAESRLAEASERARTALDRLRERDAQAAEISAALGRAHAESEAHGAQIARLERALEQRQAALSAARQASADAERALREFSEQPAPIVDAAGRDELVASMESARAAELDARAALEAARERARSERARAVGLERDARALQERQQGIERARRERDRQRLAAESVRDALPPALDQVGDDLAAAQVSLDQAKQARAREHQALAEARARAREADERVQHAAAAQQRAQMGLHEHQVRLDALHARAREELAIDADSLVAEYGPHVPVPVTGDWAGPMETAREDAGVGDAGEQAVASPGSGQDQDTDTPTVPFGRDQQRVRLERAKRMLARLGRVNPLALEEYAALEQRYTYMSDQLADLESTRKDLLEISAALDGKMRDILVDAFADTQRAFDQILPILFPGGRGAISLTDPEHPLESGIDVHIKPAGKSIDRLSLLSGGERSLGAIALLVAIFTARPSPFYIMDEVEAALDDANLGRLLAVFGRLREHSQLIVITHQKRTMEIADALYGVSMHADGVSAVVGQRMSEIGGNERNEEDAHA